MKTLFWVCIGIVGYTYLVYPVMIALLGRFRQIRPSNGIAPALASVVLVVHNEEKRIRQRIGNLRQQRPAGIIDEIVVVSDASDDGTEGIVRELAADDPHLRLVVMPERGGKAAGIGAGVAAARNDHIVFADARQEFMPDTVERLLARFADATVGAVSGELQFRAVEPGRVAESIGLYWRYEVWIRRNEARYDSVTGCPGSVYAVRKNLVPPMPTGLVLDDVWIPLHVVMQGKRVVYESRAIAVDSPSDTLGSEFARKVRTLAGNVQLVLASPRLVSPLHNRLWWMFTSHKLMRLVVPYALVGALLSNLALSGSFYTTVLVLQLLFYALGLVGYLSGAHGRACRLCSAVKVFLGINAAAVVGLLAALRGQSHTLWAKPRVQV